MGHSPLLVLCIRSGYLKLVRIYVFHHFQGFWIHHILHSFYFFIGQIQTHLLLIYLFEESLIHVFHSLRHLINLIVILKYIIEINLPYSLIKITLAWFALVFCLYRFWLLWYWLVTLIGADISLLLFLFLLFKLLFKHVF